MLTVALLSLPITGFSKDNLGSYELMPAFPPIYHPGAAWPYGTTTDPDSAWSKVRRLEHCENPDNPYTNVGGYQAKLSAYSRVQYEQGIMINETTVQSILQLRFFGKYFPLVGETPSPTTVKFLTAKCANVSMGGVARYHSGEGY